MSAELLKHSVYLLNVCAVGVHVFRTELQSYNLCSSSERVSASGRKKARHFTFQSRQERSALICVAANRYAPSSFGNVPFDTSPREKLL